MNTWRGRNLTISIFGESHGVGVGIVCDGLPCGIKLDTKHIAHMLDLRKPRGGATTQRREDDEYEILSGVTDGRTNGSPLCVFFRNRDVKSDTYNAYVPRPSHADFAAYVKYDGQCDLRGGGHFSARLTAPLVFLGAICESELRNMGITAMTAITESGGVKGKGFYDTVPDEGLAEKLDTHFPLIDESVRDDMEKMLSQMRDAGDTVGASVELCMTGLPVGIGEPFFDSLESRLAAFMFSVPAVKAVEFGKGTDFARMRGTEAADEYDARGVKEKITGNREARVAHSNNAGGIIGGLSSSMPLIMRVTFKPIPSVGQELRSVDMRSLEPVIVRTEGRHDVCAALRGACVVRSSACICIYDLLI